MFFRRHPTAKSRTSQNVLQGPDERGLRSTEIPVGSPIMCIDRSGPTLKCSLSVGADPAGRRQKRRSPGAGRARRRSTSPRAVVDRTISARYEMSTCGQLRVMNQWKSVRAQQTRNFRCRATSKAIRYIAAWSSGSSSGSYPEGRRFESCRRYNLLSDLRLVS